MLAFLLLPKASLLALSHSILHYAPYITSYSSTKGGVAAASLLERRKLLPCFLLILVARGNAASIEQWPPCRSGTFPLFARFLAVLLY